MKVSTLLLFVLILTMLSAGCAAQPAATQTAAESASAATAAAEVKAPAKLNIFAAASLTDAFSEIGKLFEAAHPEVRLIFNFAGSQQLAQQIIEGAPADVFASANQKQMDAVIQAGGIEKDTQQTFARNRLAVIYPQDNPGGLADLKDLTKPGLKLVLAAKEVPVGQYSLDFLEKASTDAGLGLTFKDNVLKNVVSYEENVKVVLTKVVLGEADAGIVYTSDISGQGAAQVERLAIPDALNVIAAYPIAPVKASKNPTLAQAFVDLVLSKEGQEILAKYNFIPVK